MLMGLPTRGYLSAAAVRGMGCECCTQKKQPPGRAGAYHVGRRGTSGWGSVFVWGDGKDVRWPWAVPAP